MSQKMRLQKFYKLWLSVQPFRYAYKEELKQWHLTVCQYEGLENYQNEQEIGFVDPGYHWGKTGDTGIFTREIQVPIAFKGYPLYLEIITGGEAMLFLNGKPFQGNDPNHYRVLLSPNSTGKERYSVQVESFVRVSHNEIGESRFDAGATGEFSQADICAVHPEAQEFLWDIQYLLEMWKEDDRHASQIIKILTHVFTSFDPTDHESFLAYVQKGRLYLREALSKLGHRESDLTLWMIGQSHLDLAWFWRKDETYRKVVRTFSSVLRNMEQYDFYRFMMPQVKLFAMLKQVSPDLYRDVKEKVLEGRIEPAGLLYVEPDTNLVNGEWLVRQILLGRNFYQQEFGQTPRVESLIDAFGYSGNLPQILRKSGIEAVFVTKMRWYNDTNVFPYSAFWWKGIDGTKLLSATMPGFNMQCNNQSAKFAIEQNLQPEFVKDIPVFFGWGDGGGGADENHLQGLRRLMSWYKSAQVKPSGFFEYCQQLKETSDDLPTWWGEIYQEGHRGCYTSQANSKKLNRQSESLYRSTEFIHSFASVLGDKFGLEKFRENVELILINQFHDILPGSAGRQIYLDSYQDYEKVLTEGAQLRKQWSRSIHQKINTQGEGTAIIVWNFNQSCLPALVKLSWPRKQAGTLRNAQGEAIPYTFENDHLLFSALNLPSLGYEVFHFFEEQPAEALATKLSNDHSLENERYAVNFNSFGQISRLYDKKSQRDLLVEGTVGNCLKLYFDVPKSNDAWDIDSDYKDAYQILKGELLHGLQADALKQWVTFRYCFGSSQIEQDVILWNDSNRLDFETRVQWHERHRLLKAEFIFDINTSKAVYDIPFGAIERDTRPNNSYQQAKFEVPGLSMVDVSEGNYGVSLVSEHKNGFGVNDQLVSISLLRAPTFPDPEADQGDHEFHYSLIGHCGDFRDGHIIHESRNLINQVYAAQEENHPGKLPPRFSFLSVDKENVIVEALKAAEDGSGLILRVYETYGQQDTCTLSINFDVTSVTECNLVEESISAPIEVENHQISFRIRPFEIKTFRLLFN
jgi:alpha-mannosidase